MGLCWTGLGWRGMGLVGSILGLTMFIGMPGLLELGIIWAIRQSLKVEQPTVLRNLLGETLDIVWRRRAAGEITTQAS